MVTRFGAINTPKAAKIVMFLTTKILFSGNVDMMIVMRVSRIDNSRSNNNRKHDTEGNDVVNDVINVNDSDSSNTKNDCSTFVGKEND